MTNELLDLVELMAEKPDLAAVKAYSKDFEAEVVPEVRELDDRAIAGEIEGLDLIGVKY